MEFTSLFTLIAKVLAGTTLLTAIATVFAWITKQKWRFQAFGTTSFLVVLTVGAATLAIIPSIVHKKVPGTGRYVAVFDRGGSRAVITVKPDITPETLDPTLHQALADLNTMGRSVDGPFKVQARTVVHPSVGVTRLIQVGSIAVDNKVENSTPVVTIDRTALQEAKAMAAQFAAKPPSRR
ncbi:MAG: hypothetical protein H7Y37_00195 [Anaerolineae bacterium]|nr:hypothetical protein [Gloeobacterales cyanobacterium ES-bin-313]